MTPQARRRLIPIIVLFLAGSILSVLIFGPKKPSDPKNQPIAESPKEVVDQKPETETNTPEKTPAPKASSPETFTPKETVNENLKPFEVLSLATFSEDPLPATLGSLTDYENWKMEVVFTQNGASISSIRFSDIYETVDGKLAWNKYRKDGGEQPPLDDLYLLANTSLLMIFPLLS